MPGPSKRLRAVLVSLGPIGLLGWAASSRSATVLIETFQFGPDTVRVAPGAAVRWENRDAIEHTVTAEGGSALFEGVLTGPGATFEHRFRAAGTVRYFCARHQFMKGVVLVTP